jgi:long-subunit acyl-CoA synthetase (AMP-forming)
MSNVVDYLFEFSKDSQPALITATQEYSYGDLKLAVQNMADQFRQLPLQKDCKIAIIASNSIFWVASYLATLKNGGVSVPLSAALTPDQ